MMMGFGFGGGFGGGFSDPFLMNRDVFSGFGGGSSGFQQFSSFSTGGGPC